MVCKEEELGRASGGHVDTLFGAVARYVLMNLIDSLRRYKSIHKESKPPASRFAQNSSQSPTGACLCCRVRRFGRQMSWRSEVGSRKPGYKAANSWRNLGSDEGWDVMLAATSICMQRQKCITPLQPISFAITSNSQPMIHDLPD